MNIIEIEKIHREIINYKINNPNTTLVQLGNIFGRTRQGIGWILKKYGLSTKKSYGFKCFECENIIKTYDKSIPHRFCSEQCRFIHYHIELICDHCHKIFWRLKSAERRKLTDTRYTGKVYCSNICTGLGNGPVLGSLNHTQGTYTYAECAFCKRNFSIRFSDFTYKNKHRQRFYCSKDCSKNGKSMLYHNRKY